MKNKKLLLFAAMMGTIALVCALAAGCSKTPAPSDGGDQGGNTDPEPAAWEWSASMDCTGCHSTESASTKDSTTYAHMHASAGVTCTQCHSNEAVLKASHKNVGTGSMVMPDKLSDAAKVTTATCTQSGCHTVDAAFVAATAENTVLTDLNGTTVNPHTVLTLTAGHSDLNCADCHNQHSTAIKASNACVICHHAGVYECNTCH